jgi:hypothetical protein
LALKTDKDLVPFVAFGLGAALALLIFPFGLLFGFPSYWVHVQGDNAQALIGYIAFGQDHWRWPLFQTKLLSPPEGVNILFTDPIPMLALLGKAVYKITNYLPNYFGPWLLLAYGLQPVCAYFLLRSLQMTRIAALLGSMLFLLLPAFVFRYGHFPLLGHWLLLLMLLLYFFVTQSGDFRYIVSGAAIAVVCVLINPYILVMVGAIYFASLGDGVLRKTVSPILAGSAAVLLIAGVLGAAILFGFVDPTKPTPAGGGFGLYSMNLLSPVTPQLSAWPGHESFVLDATQGQYEGYNYLGGGVLALLGLALVFAWRPMGAFVRRHVVLFLAAAALGAYALSTRIYAGNQLIAQIPLDNIALFAKFSNIFRSSGRFFWPLGYLLLTAALYALFVRFGHKRFVMIAAAAILVQAIDVRPLMSSVSNRAGPSSDVLDRQKWIDVVRAHDAVLIVPQFVCTSQSNRAYIYSIGLIAAELRVPTNSAILNRSNIDCVAEKVALSRDFRALATRSKVLLVAFKDEVNANVVHLENDSSGFECRDARFAYVCSENQSAIRALGTELAPPPYLTLNKPFLTNETGQGLLFLEAGWAEPGKWGVWGVGPESAILARLAAPVCGDLMLHVTVQPFAAGNHFVNTSDFWVNGRKVSVQHLDSPGERELNLRIPNPTCEELFEIVFKFSDLKSPKQLGLSTDPRPISWALRSLSLTQLQ